MQTVSEKMNPNRKPRTDYEVLKYERKLNAKERQLDRRGKRSSKRSQAY